MLWILFSFFTHSVYLFRARYTSSQKIRIFFTYLILTLELPFLKIFKIKKIKILHYTVEGFDSDTLHLLFGEVFVRNEYFFKSKKNKPVIVDCGSNIGVSVLFFKYIYPQSIIYAFEPDPQTFTLLEKNIEKNHLKNVFAYNSALAQKKGKISFFIDDTPGGLRMSLIKERMPVQEIKVDSISLADFIKDKRIDFIKMDVEGYEQVVIDDMKNKKVLSQVPEMIIEYHHHIEKQEEKFADFLHLLTESGYKSQFDTSLIPIYSKEKFQDILILAYR